MQELTNLKFKAIIWNKSFSGRFGIKLNVGESVKSGSSRGGDTYYYFDQSYKITKIVTTVDKSEAWILQIKFFSSEELLCRVGYSDEDTMRCGGRVVAFEIAADEQLIGAELHNGPASNGDGDHFLGVTWIKMKIAN